MFVGCGREWRDFLFVGPRGKAIRTSETEMESSVFHRSEALTEAETDAAACMDRRRCGYHKYYWDDPKKVLHRVFAEACNSNTLHNGLLLLESFWKLLSESQCSFALLDENHAL